MALITGAWFSVPNLEKIRLAGQLSPTDKLSVSSSYGPGQAPVEIFQPRIQIKRRLVLALLWLLTVILLSVSFAPFGCWYLAYLALVPWTMALICGKSNRWTVLLAYLAGVIYWAASIYWLSWVTPYAVGYIAGVIYLSLYFLVGALVLRAAGRRQWPMWITLPVVWVALEYARAYVIGGFPWFYLAHSQYSQLRLIQICDITGQYGVSFFVAMVNGAIVDLLVSPLFYNGRAGIRLRRRVIVAPIVVVVSACGLLFYGLWRISQDTTRPGPVIGIVQHAFPVSLKTPPLDESKILFDHTVSTRKIGPGCDLIIWSESMLPFGMNPEYLRMAASSSQKNLAESWRQAQAIGELSVSMGSSILAGGPTLHLNPNPIDERDRWLFRNSAALFNGSPVPAGLYSKVHLVPFGEYVPFRYSWLGLYKVLRWFVPPEMPQLDPGRFFSTFEITGSQGEKWTLASPICYEGTFARVCRQMVMRNGDKTVDFLVNLSNDGWFVRQIGGGGFKASTEHAQHLISYVFRAIETRCPVVRAVNTGISGSIDSTGRIVSVLESHGARTMVSGTLRLDGQDINGHGPKILVDDRVTMYSLAGDLFAISVSLVALGCIVWLRLTGSTKKQKKTNQE